MGADWQTGGSIAFVTLRTRTINRRYRLERRIALAETTETWLAFDSVLHRAVAVTLPRQEVLRDGTYLVEFLQRSRIATALHHRCIIAAYDSGEDGELPYLVTEYLGGDSLTDIIRTESPFDVDDVAILVDQLAGALDYAHQRGFIHGSLSAADIVVDSQGLAKLLGLGLPAGSIDARAPATESSPRSIEDDISALGALAFEMLTGEPPDSVGAESSGEAYLIDPEVPRNASDIVAIALGSGFVHFTSAGAFARSLSEWRSFDPGEFFIAPRSATKRITEAPSLTDESPSHQLAVHESFEFEIDSYEDFTDQPTAPKRHTHWFVIAIVALAMAASIIIWHSSEPVIGTTAPLPSPVESLAQLSGF